MTPAARRSLAIVALLAVIAVLAVPKLISHDRAEATGEPSPTPSSTSSALRVSVVELAPQRLVEELATTGTLRADEQVELVSEVAGKVVAVHFEEGRRVTKDQLLLELDASTLEAQVERIRHQLALAERREQRQRELLDQGVLSQDAYELVLNQVDLLRSELRVTETQIAKTRILAPFSGIIGLRRVSPGSYLSPQTPIATLQDLDRVKIDFSVPEKYAPRLETGGVVTFFVQGDPRAFEASIYAIEPSVDPETRSLLLRARCANPERTLLPGAFADVRLVVEEVDDALTVPSIAVIPELGGRKVFVEENGVARARRVETGIRGDDAVQLVSGVSVGERVITTATQQLRDGLEVEATVPPSFDQEPGE